jgi:hypothetical protein
MFKVETIDVKELEAELKTFAKRAYPFATKAAINNAAFKARDLWQREISVDMIERNKFTRQSIRVEQSRTLDVDRQSATVGSIAPYMKDQEFGGVKRSKGKHGVPIATSYAAGQEGQQPRTRLARRANKLASIQLRKRIRSSRNKKQALLFKVQDAVTSGKRFIFHDFESGKKKGIFRVVGGSKKFKRGWPTGAKLKMVADMSSKVITIPRNPTLKPVVKQVEILMPAMWRKALVFQVRRHGLFK